MCSFYIDFEYKKFLYDFVKSEWNLEWHQKTFVFAFCWILWPLNRASHFGYCIVQNGFLLYIFIFFWKLLKMISWGRVFHFHNSRDMFILWTSYPDYQNGQWRPRWNRRPISWTCDPHYSSSGHASVVCDSKLCLANPTEVLNLLIHYS